MAKAYKPARERITEFKINWNIVSWPGKAWAKRVFPELDTDEAVVKLADAIFDASELLLMILLKHGMITMKNFV